MAARLHMTWDSVISKTGRVVDYYTIYLVTLCQLLSLCGFDIIGCYFKGRNDSMTEQLYAREFHNLYSST
jgi:hypothetical protein